MELLLVSVVIVCFVLLQAIEVFSFGSRVAGKTMNQIALGYSLQQAVFTASRFLLVLFLPALAFLVESKISIINYSLMASLALFISALISFLILIKLNLSQGFFQKVISNYENIRIPRSIYLALFKNKNKKFIDININFHTKVVNRKKFLTSFTAYFFLSSGFFFAFLLSNIFYENRLTLSQITPFFHGIGALLVAFYLDPMLSRSMDNEHENILWMENIYSVLFGRISSYFFTAFLFVLIAIFVK